MACPLDIISGAVVAGIRCQSLRLQVPRLSLSMGRSRHSEGGNLPFHTMPDAASLATSLPPALPCLIRSRYPGNPGGRDVARLAASGMVWEGRLPPSECRDLPMLRESLGTWTRRLWHLMPVANAIELRGSMCEQNQV